MNKHNLNLVKKLLQVLKDKCVRYLILSSSAVKRRISSSFSWFSSVNWRIKLVGLCSFELLVFSRSLLALSSMKVMSHSHLKVVLIPFNSCDATFIDDRDSRSLDYLYPSVNFQVKRCRKFRLLLALSSMKVMRSAGHLDFY